MRKYEKHKKYKKKKQKKKLKLGQGLEEKIITKPKSRSPLQ